MGMAQHCSVPRVQYNRLRSMYDVVESSVRQPPVSRHKPGRGNLVKRQTTQQTGSRTARPSTCVSHSYTCTAIHISLCTHSHRVCFDMKKKQKKLPTYTCMYRAYRDACKPIAIRETILISPIVSFSFAHTRIRALSFVSLVPIVRHGHCCHYAIIISRLCRYYIQSN